MKLLITAIVLTYNEEANLEKCLKSISSWSSQIIVVDSFSTDKTLEIAKNYNAEIYSHEFQNQAQQFNWALDNIEIENEWILRLDADEYLTEELKKEIEEILKENSFVSETLTEAQPRFAGRERVEETKEFSLKNINGFYIKRRVYFMGHWIKHGGYYPIWFLRLWRKGKARMENRKMDEHATLLEGRAEKLNNDFIDDNRKGLRAWIQKHKNYAIREADEVLAGNIGVGRQRLFYYKTPPFLRVFIYFIYRYFFRLGFLDGATGLVFHFLHGFWYRFLVDIKIFQKRIENKIPQ